jgi:hypothetical protein
VESSNYKENNDGNNNGNNESDLKWKSKKHREVGWKSSVGITTRYGFDGPEIEFRRGRDFLHHSRPALFNRYCVFRGGKAAEGWL